MSRLIIVFLDSVLSCYIALYCSSKIIDKKIKYKDYKFWLCFLFLILYTTTSYMLTTSFVRIIIYYLVLSVVNLILFKSNVLQSVVTSFITMVLVFVAELFFTLIISILMVSNIEEIKNIFFADFVSNAIITLIMVMLITFKPICNFFQKIIKSIHFKGNQTILMYSILSLSSLAILLYYIYFQVDILCASILCFVLVITFSFLTLYLFKEKNDNQKLQFECDSLLDNLEEYEKMYQLQRMINHDNKSELSAIRGLVGKDNKKLIQYIDDLMDMKIIKNARWMETLKRIPEPTLRGLLYYKLTNMEHMNVKIEFDISREFTVKKFKSISYDLNKKICKILGIYLDNAIQAVENLDEKHIKISFYLDALNSNMMIISIMNNYKGFIEMDRLNEKGYSTKGKGRGLGLAIAGEILNNEPKLSNQIEIIRNNFVQELKIVNE